MPTITTRYNNNTTCKAGKKASWVFHGKQGWYTGPAISHYRYIVYYITKTHHGRITDTATIIPKHIPIPQPSYEDHIRRSAENLFQLLKHKQKLLLPKAPDLANQASLETSKILHRYSTPSLNTNNDATQSISSKI